MMSNNYKEIQNSYTMTTQKKTGYKKLNISMKRFRDRMAKKADEKKPHQATTKRHKTAKVRQRTITWFKDNCRET